MKKDGSAPQGDSEEREPDRTLLDPAVPSVRPSDGDQGETDSRPGDTLIVPTKPAKLPEIPGIQLLEEIGRGGMGVVYRGVQGYLERTVAVKLLNSSHRGGEYEQRFRREARILAGLTHPHIVACYQAGVTDGGDCYLVMEFIDGPSLRRWLDQNGRVPIAQALRLCRDLAVALDHAHEANIIHRDVKPENVLLQRDEKAGRSHPFPFHAKLADLGLARPTGGVSPEMNLTVQASVMGTPATMAPEQFDDPLSVDYRADIYGLGCVLFHAVTGQVAYPQGTISATIASKMKGLAPDSRHFQKGCPEGVSGLIARMLAPRREDRPQSYAEVVATCETLLAALRPSGTPTRNRKRWLIVGTLMVALSAGAWVWFAVTPVDKPPEPPPSPPSPAPLPPLSITGPDTARENEPIVLHAGPSDAEATFVWTIESSPELSPDKTPAATGAQRLEVIAPSNDSDYALTFHVSQVESGERRAATKTVAVDVNAPPTAEIVDVARQFEAGDTIVVQGRGIDPEGESLTYHWRSLGTAPLIALDGAKEARLLITAPEADASYELRLEFRVSDGMKDSRPCSVTIPVAADPAGKPLEQEPRHLWNFGEVTGIDWETGRGEGLFSRDDSGELIFDCQEELVTRKRPLPRGAWRVSGLASSLSSSGKSGFLVRNGLDEDVALQLLVDGEDTTLRCCLGGESHVLGSCAPACRVLAGGRTDPTMSIAIAISWTPGAPAGGTLSISGDAGGVELHLQGRPRELVLFARQLGAWQFSDFEIAGR